MKFTLVTPKGRIYTFYIRAAAECYQRAYGGTLITDSVFAMETDPKPTAKQASDTVDYDYNIG